MDFLIPVLSGEQMHSCDAAAIQNEPISSIELMERASRAMYNALQTTLKPRQPITVFCGPGNNGGDGLCMARMLIADGFDVIVYRCLFGKKASADNVFYAKLLQGFRANILHEPKDLDPIHIKAGALIVDALFGTGLTKNIEGIFADLIEKINASGNTIISLDVPSGLKDSSPQNGAPYIQSKETIAIESPKTAFFYAENQVVFRLVSAGIQLQNSTSNTWYLSPAMPWQNRILRAIPHKKVFDHKGTSGSVLLVGGNNGMHGAIALAASACVNHGAGLTTVLAPAGARLYLGNIAKAMHLPKKMQAASVAILDTDKYDVLSIGPGLGSSNDSKDLLKQLLLKWNKPAVLDADALNLLAADKTLWKLVQPGSIITPHPGEFQRLFGTFPNTAEQLETAKKIAKEKGIFILAKNKYSALICPDGKVVFNGSGGPHLAQGGSGDTLAGALAAWLARTNDPEMACIAAMYLCGIGEVVH
jgi:hydroxyethylthiazole kinase-like uncharacterized protein yjeF